MHWLLIGYMFLFIHRPFEVWPVLGDFHVERIYILATVLALGRLAGQALGAQSSTLTPTSASRRPSLCCWAISPWADAGAGRRRELVQDSRLLHSVGHLRRTTKGTAAGLRRLPAGDGHVHDALAQEFVGGRYTYRMGIVRLLGVDTSLGDPNSFGASIVFALPFARAFWHAANGGG